MPNLCETVGSDCGRARATYRPDWSTTRPWVTYQRGTAGQHFATERAALAHLEARGYRFKRPHRYTP